jgi:hypothetical protein
MLDFAEAQSTRARLAGRQSELTAHALAEIERGSRVARSVSSSPPAGAPTTCCRRHRGGGGAACRSCSTCGSIAVATGQPDASDGLDLARLAGAIRARPSCWRASGRGATGHTFPAVRDVPNKDGSVSSGIDQHDRRALRGVVRTGYGRPT